MVERGFGHTPYGDHFAHVCGLQVVLANGDLVHTGSARFRGAETGPVYRWGLGPVLDGLFTQSNFGIVVSMSIWLMPAPEHFEAFFFRCDDERGLGSVIDALRPLRLRVGRWNGSGGLYGTRAQVAEAKRLVRAQLKGKVAALQFLDDRKLKLARRFSRAYRRFTGWDLTAALNLLEPVYGLMRGIPTDRSLASAYWRKRTPPPAMMNPDRDGCGLLWCAPVAPLDGEHAERLAQISVDMLLSHGFEPMVSMTLITERALTCIVSICYDRAVPHEDERAMRCYRALLTALTAAGYHSYRLGIQANDEMRSDASYTQLLAPLKQTLDPSGILAPGRYGISVTR
jgi:4-cresol dehydrogenase (hydroxylating) flavoprotein subunit